MAVAPFGFTTLVAAHIVLYETVVERAVVPLLLGVITPGSE